MSFTADEQRRIDLTTAVRDTDAIPKVDGAGGISERDGTRVQLMHCGVVIEEHCYCGPWMTEIIRQLRGHHEPQEETVFHALVERLKADTPAPVMIELGSNWSYYSMWLKHALPDTRCVLVEPDPVNLEVGRRNFALNGMDGTFLQAAAGSAHGASVRLVCESDLVIRDLPIASVDGLIRDHGLGRVDLLLCDTQGAELDVIAGAAEALRDGRLRFLCVSTHLVPGDPTIHQRCLQLLRSHGAHVIAEHSIPESCSGDGLVVASADPRDTGFTVQVSHVRARDSIWGELEYELERLQGWRGVARILARPVLRHPRVDAALSRRSRT